MPLRPRFAASLSVRRLAIALVGITILAFAGWDAAQRGLEDWRAARWHAEVRAWNEGRAVPTEAQWARAVQGLRDALRLAPRDPEIWEYLGLLYDVGSRRFAPADRAGPWHVYTEYSLIHYRQAALLRPTSPYAWAGVAVMKYRLGQLDGEFSQALASAMQLGPWEPGVQLIASDIGLGIWDGLSQPLRNLVRENWRRTAVRQAGALAKLAHARQMGHILCQELLDAVKNQLKCPQESGAAPAPTGGGMKRKDVR